MTDLRTTDNLFFAKGDLDRDRLETQVLSGMMAACAVRTLIPHRALACALLPTRRPPFRIPMNCPTTRLRVPPKQSRRLDRAARARLIWDQSVRTYRFIPT